MADVFYRFFGGELFELFPMYGTVADHADVVHFVPNIGRNQVFKFEIVE